MAKKIVKISIGILSVIIIYFLAVVSGLTIGTLPPYVSFAVLDKHQDVMPPTQSSKDSLSYKGENGVDAFTLLQKKQHAWIELDRSGLITSINFRKADVSKHEYWAFYVNGKLADVGPASYITKNTDIITWKIETY